MEAKVTKAYTDRITGVVRFAGEAVDLTAERLEELSRKGYVAPAEPGQRDAAGAGEPAAAGPKEPSTPEPEGAEDAGDRAEETDIDLMTVAELAEYIIARGGTVPSKVRKAELLEIAKGL